MAKVSLRNYNREIETMIDRGQLDEAIAHCQHILKTFPKHLETYRLLGKTFLEYKRYKDAVDIFSRVLVVEPNDFVANVGMSIIRDEEDKLDDAIWHMERAFEVQSANPAIQGELQRLYGRREGVQPPRIRMTRGALAHMYMQGELYPQAISEVKSVLNEDAGRTDMQVLMARAYFKSGKKNDAADAASAVLRRYPYCLDANRILVEILGNDRPENSQLYRERVIELDPYAAQVSGSIFEANEVGDAAVTLERLEWSGQPADRSDWRTAQAISLESGSGQGPQAQPDWLKSGGFADATPAPLPPTPKVAPPLPASTSNFDFPASTSSFESQPVAEPTPEAEIPDFLRAAGWGESTGTFDESKPIFADEPVAPPASTSDAMPIAQGDMPDWLKAMAPPQAAQQPAQPAEEEEVLPDWINKIGKSALPAAGAVAASDEFDWLNPTDDQASPTSVPTSDDQPDWMKQLDQPTSAQATDQPDWMKGFGEEPVSNSSALPADDQFDWLKQPDQLAPAEPTDQPDWMKGFGEEPASAPASALPADDQFDWMKQPDQPASTQPTDQPDWMKGFGEEPASAPASALPADDQPDWMNQLDQPASTQPTDQPDWMKGFGEEPASTPTLPADDQPDWMNQLDQSAPAQSTDQPDWMKGFGEEPASTPALPADDQPDWMNQLDQPASTQPTDQPDWMKGFGEEPASAPALPADDQPDWMKQLSGQSAEPAPVAPMPDEFDFLNELTTPVQPVAEPTPASVPAANVEELGKSQSEIDDSLAWFESLAAKQGATEGLLIKPEDRKDVEPDWVKKIKSSNGQLSEPKVPEPIPSQPAANVEELGKSQSEIDDSLAWFESLAAKQGATEGLLIKPEDRKDVEPDWVKKIKSSNGQLNEQKVPEPIPSQPVASVEDLGKSQSEIDDSLAWFESLAAKQGATEGLLIKPEDRKDVEPDWVKQVKSAPVADSAPVPAQLIVEPTPASVPAANVEDLGKSQSEIDDSLAWFESLAAKQGATEGLLIKPEDRKDVEPD
ncbi:MAG: tetratricopeptide repeat protein, partial [Chloroflexota bacterium]